MTASRTSWRLALGTSLALALSVSIPAAAEEEEKPARSRSLQRHPAARCRTDGPAGPGQRRALRPGLADDRRQRSIRARPPWPRPDPLLGPGLGAHDRLRPHAGRRRRCTGPLPRSRSRLLRNILVTRDFGQARRSRPSRTSRPTPTIPSTSCWASSTTPFPPCPPTSASTAASAGKAPTRCPTCSRTSAPAVTRSSPSTATATST